MKRKYSAILILILIVSVLLSACMSVGEELPTEAVYATQKVTKASETTTVPSTTQFFTEPYSEADDIKNLLSSLSLEEKIAQMLLVSCHPEVDIFDAVDFGVGGLCLYAFSFEGLTKDEVISMNESFQSSAKIPLIISTDEEGGTVNRISLNDNLRAVPFWAPADLLSEGGWELVKSDTEEKADLLLSLGVNVNLAPVCDVPLSEDNYIFDRCVSLDPEVTAKYSALVTSVMKEKGIGSTLKHFPGYGGSIDTHENVSYDSRPYSDFENKDFLPFVSGINAGADSVLVSHNIVECMDADMPASLSENVHSILRNELSFDGVIMTDDLAMDGITEFTDGENAAVAAVLAGNDLLCCENYREATVAIQAAVEDGRISEERINSSVERILKWKAELSLI